MSDTLFDVGEGVLGPRPGPDATPREIRAYVRKRRRLLTMHQRHGAGPDGARCGRCQHFVRRPRSGGAETGSYYRKCELFGLARSESTDWRATWPACGLFVHVAKKN